MTIEKLIFTDSSSGTNRKEAQLIAEAIEGTDWDETPVLDVVKYRPVAPGDDPPLPEYEIERYAGEIPDYSAYEDGRRTVEVHRITEAWCEERGIDPETGEPVEEDDDDDDEGGVEIDVEDAGRGAVEEADGNDDDGDRP